MRNIVVLLSLALLFPASALAQKKKVDLASDQLEKFNSSHKAKDLADARKNIDEASVNAETKEDARTWIVRGNVYMAAYTDDYNKKLEALATGSSRKEIAYSKADDGLLATASTSYIRAIQTDKDQANYSEITARVNDCLTLNMLSGQANYQQQNYTTSWNCFSRCVDIRAAQGITDTNSMYNAVLTGQQGKLYDKAIPWAVSLTKWDYEGSTSWWLLTQCYLGKGDTMLARKTVDEGLAKHPGDNLLRYKKVDVELACGNNAAADAVLLEMMGGGSWMDPYTNGKVGSAYDQLANPTGADGTALPKPFNYELLWARAEFFYKKALDQKPDYFDIQYNLGILYYNRAAYISEIDPDRPEGSKNDLLWNDMLTKAVVELEKARKLEPEDYNTLKGLSICYAYMGESEKYKETKEKLKELDGK